MTHLREAARQVRVTESTDVIVCGGGPAGIAAALASAKAGAKTRLIEVHGRLGGVWTASALSYIMDSGNKSGIMELIKERLFQAEGSLHPEGNDFTYDAETMAFVLEGLAAEFGLDVRLYTRVVAAQVTNGRLKSIVTESKSGREAWQAKAFIDATGDGDLGALAGCAFDMGKETTGAVQPLSLIGLVTGLNLSEVEPFLLTDSCQVDAKENLLKVMRQAGSEPSYTHPTLINIREGLYALMSNHEYGVSALDAQGLSDATLRARQEVHHQVKALRKLGSPWRDMRIVTTGQQIGVREGRRLKGRYTVTVSDLVQGSRHEDAVCRVTLPVDVHATNQQDEAVGREGVVSQPYDIPLRALIAQDVTGLLMAGRCISGDFLAHASYRVTGNAVSMGQAAGATAALASSLDLLPHEVPWDDIRTVLFGLTKGQPLTPPADDRTSLYV